MSHNLGIFSKGFWLGEETHYLDQPLFYSVKAVTDLIVFKIAMSDLDKLPKEINDAVSKLMKKKLSGME
jgi:CRP-like cAMP-binding protein